MDQPDPTPLDEEVLSTQIIERLLRYDELDEAELQAIEADPTARQELHRLQLAEAWLSEPSPAGALLGADSATGSDTTDDDAACPSAEDLFDFGQRLEPTDHSNARQVELSHHLASCADCRALVATLALRPPSPLIVVDSPLPDIHTAPAPRPRSTRALRLARGPLPASRSALRHLPILVAASLLAILITSGWPTSVMGKGPGQFPSPASMRGASAQRLVSPMNLVLSRTTDLPGLPRLNDIQFELRPRSGDVRYEVYIYAGNSSVLQREQERKPLHRIESRGPQPSTLTLAGPLPIGRYSWEAWSYRGGDTPEFMGEADFRVVANRGLEEFLRREGATIAAVRELDSDSFIADARALARTLCRDGVCSLYEAERYLAITPVR